MANTVGLIVGLVSLTLFLVLSIVLLIEVQPSSPPALTYTPDSVHSNSNLYQSSYSDKVPRKKPAATVNAVGLTFGTCGPHDVKCPCTKNNNCKATTKVRLSSEDCPSSFDTQGSCASLNTWSISEEATNYNATLGGPAGAISSEIDTVFRVSAVKAVESPLGVLVSAALHLSIVNRGDCTANLSSIVVLLEQATSTHLINWAASGSENPATAGQCNSPGLASICIRGPPSLYAIPNDDDNSDNENVCSHNVPYISNLVHDASTLSPVNLALYPIPPSGNRRFCNNAVELDLSTQFSVSPANWTLMQQDPHNYTVRVLFTYNSCCGGGSSCRINIDCQNDFECIKTNQLVSPPFSLASSCAPYCDCVHLATQPIAIQDNENSECVAAATLETVLPGQICASTTFNISAETVCDTRSCDCKADASAIVGPAGTLLFEPFISSHVAISNPLCVDPVTGISLLVPAAIDVTNTFQCVYPTPITDCNYGHWSAWSTVSQPCSTECTATIRRTRTAHPSVCHSDVLPTCSAVEETMNVACTDLQFSCTYSTYGPCIETPNDTCSSSTCTVDGSETAQVTGITQYCVAGVQTSCEVSVSRPCSVNCTLPCSYGEWSAYSLPPSPCSIINFDCNSNITRTRTAIPSACPGETAVECSELIEHQQVGCNDDNFECTFGPYGECQTEGATCNVPSCTKDGVQYAPATSTDTYCVNGFVAFCDSEPVTCSLPCTVPCTYNETIELGPCVEFGTLGNVCARDVTTIQTANVCTSPIDCPSTLIKSTEFCNCSECVPDFPTTCEALITSIQEANPGAECAVTGQALTIPAQCGNQAISCPYNCPSTEVCQELELGSPFGLCSFPPPPPPTPTAFTCTVNADCNDNSASTEYVCLNGICQYSTIIIIIPPPNIIVCREEYQDRAGPLPLPVCVCNETKCKALNNNPCVNAFCGVPETASQCETVPVTCDDGNPSTVDTCVVTSNTTYVCTNLAPTVNVITKPDTIININFDICFTDILCYKSTLNTSTAQCNLPFRDPTCCTQTLGCNEGMTCVFTAPTDIIGQCVIDTIATECSYFESGSCNPFGANNCTQLPGTPLSVCLSTGKCSSVCNPKEICGDGVNSCIQSPTCNRNTCVGGKCVRIPDSSQCSDNKATTADSCDPRRCPFGNQCIHCLIETSSLATSVNINQCLCGDGSIASPA